MTNNCHEYPKFEGLSAIANAKFYCNLCNKSYMGIVVNTFSQVKGRWVLV